MQLNLQRMRLPPLGGLALRLALALLRLGEALAALRCLPLRRLHGRVPLDEEIHRFGPPVSDLLAKLLRRRALKPLMLAILLPKT
jgi:hypothetical protein